MAEEGSRVVGMSGDISVPVRKAGEFLKLLLLAIQSDLVLQNFKPEINKVKVSIAPSQSPVVHSLQTKLFT